MVVVGGTVPTIALGEPQTDPVGGAITGAFEAGLIDKGLSEMDWMVVTRLPIFAEPLQASSQHTGGQVFWGGGIGQDEEADVLDNEAEPPLFGLLVPTDEGVPVGVFQACCRPGQKGDGFAIPEGGIA